MPGSTRSTKFALVAAVTFSIAGVLSGDGLAGASYMADPAHPQTTARKVRVELSPPTALVRLDLEEPAHVDALPLPLLAPSSQRSVRLDLAEVTDAVDPAGPSSAGVLPTVQPARRVVRVTLDGLDGLDGLDAATTNDLAPRVFHADLDDAETFMTSPPVGTGPVRLVRSDL